jgi:hypothetical protein
MRGDGLCRHLMSRLYQLLRSGPPQQPLQEGEVTVILENPINKFIKISRCTLSSVSTVPQGYCLPRPAAPPGVKIARSGLTTAKGASSLLWSSANARLLEKIQTFPVSQRLTHFCAPLWKTLIPLESSWSRTCRWIGLLLHSGGTQHSTI